MTKAVGANVLIDFNIIVYVAMKCKYDCGFINFGAYIMSRIVRTLLVTFVCLSVCACSVVMASRNGGVNPKKLTQCRTRSCLIAVGATPIEHKNNKHGKLVSESFRATMPTGSAARAVMHGLLDVSTLGIWEVVGTPIEATKGKKTGYVINAQYAEDGSTIKHMTFNF